MARPAGFSSDEDEYDSFYEDDLDPINPPMYAQASLNPTEENERKLNNLFLSIVRGNFETFVQLLDEGIDADITLKDNWNPLLLAASVGEKHIVQELINRGANVNFNKDRYTTLMAACSCPSSTAPYEKSAEIARLLVENGADVNAISRKRMNALMYAASNGNTEIINLLLPICDIHAEDNQGWNALFWAVSDNHIDAVKILLEAGLNPEKTDIRGNTCMYYATSNDFEKIIQLLPSKEARKNENSVFINGSYVFEDEFENLKENERPTFFRDVVTMLYGMKCEQLTHTFNEKSMDLLNFTSLSDDRLQDLGILLSYQRREIIIGLYKFHKHSYRAKSLPIVGKNEIFSTIDLSNSIISAVRQITTMEGALSYIESEISEPVYDKEIERSLLQIQVKIKGIKEIVNDLFNKSRKWEQTTKPADLITNSSLTKRKFYVRWMSLIGILTVTFIVSKRNSFLKLKLF